jgi:hypothetical protein
VPFPFPSPIFPRPHSEGSLSDSSEGYSKFDFIASLNLLRWPPVIFRPAPLYPGSCLTDSRCLQAITELKDLPNPNDANPVTLYYPQAHLRQYPQKHVDQHSNLNRQRLQ